MATQIVMDHTGDTRHHFDAADIEALSKAEERFEKLTGLGFTAAVRSTSHPFGRRRATVLYLLRIEVAPTVSIKRPPTGADKKNYCCRTASSISHVNGRGMAGSSSITSVIRRQKGTFGCSRPGARRRSENQYLS